MKEKPLSKFRVKVPFDTLVHKVYKKAAPRKVSENEAYFSMEFYPQIIVEGVITGEGESCLIEFQSIIKSKFSKLFKFSISFFSFFFIIAVFLSDMSLSEKVWASIFAIGIIPFTHFVFFLNSELFCAIADSNVRRVFEKAVKK